MSTDTRQLEADIRASLEADGYKLTTPHGPNHHRPYAITNADGVIVGKYMTLADVARFANRDEK